MYAGFVVYRARLESLFSTRTFFISANSTIFARQQFLQHNVTDFYNKGLCQSHLIRKRVTENNEYITGSS